MRAAVPRMTHVGPEAMLGPRWDRSRAPLTPWRAQGRAVRMGPWDVDEAVRARARWSDILAARPEVARGRDALERGEGDGQIDGAPDGGTPCRRAGPGVGGGGEHVFVTVWG